MDEKNSVQEETTQEEVSEQSLDLEQSSKRESESLGQKIRKVKPHHIIIALGVFFALFTAASGIVSSITGFKGDSEITREVFGNIPAFLKILFYIVIPVLLILGSIMFANRAKNWQRGVPDERRVTLKNVKSRMAEFRSGVYMKTLLRQPGAGIMHSLIYFSFLILLAVTTTLEIDHQLPDDLKFLHGQVYQAYSAVGDAAGVVFIVGIVWAILRRFGPTQLRPYRIRGKVNLEYAIILGTFLVIGVTGFLAEGFRIANDGTPDFERWSFIGYPLARLVEDSSSLAGWHQFWWVVHVISFCLFLIILPITMLRHMFTSPLNMWLKNRGRPKGAMRPMPNLMETELETFGANTVEDFTWKQLLDTDACTMCGRCTDICPAHFTGKPLDPREIVLKTGEVMAATGSPPVTPPLSTDPEITISASNLFERITSEEVWGCTSCRACDEVCPVDIEILDKILDMRRYLSLMESDFPSELGGAYRGMENQGNPWGLPQSDRAAWADDMEGINIVDGGSPLESEYLYWVGCAGSFDDKNQKVTKALTELLQRAGVSFSILGPAETCTGDPARRSGNEYLFQMLASQNVETLNAMGVKKIITQCPHCLNTMSNEYPELGGYYEVIHHSELLEQLIDSGQLDVSKAELDDQIAYHDPCYLGRHNDIYIAPRRVVSSIDGVELVEAPRNGVKAMCCGAGGARMWMEEQTGKQVNVERSQELLATGAGRIATACPFCYIMIDDGVKGEGVDDDEVRVADIALHLLEGIKRGESRGRELVSAGVGTVEVSINGATNGNTDTGEGLSLSNGNGVGNVNGNGRSSVGDMTNGNGGLDMENRAQSPGLAPPVTTKPLVPMPPPVPAPSPPKASPKPIEADTPPPEPPSSEPSSESPPESASETPETSEELEASAEAKVEEGPKPEPKAEPEEAKQKEAEAETKRGPDDFSLIKGMSPRHIHMLAQRNINTFNQISELTEEQILELETYLDSPGRIQKWGWVEQAELLLRDV